MRLKPKKLLIKLELKKLLDSGLYRVKGGKNGGGKDRDRDCIIQFFVLFCFRS